MWENYQNETVCILENYSIYIARGMVSKGNEVSVLDKEELEKPAYWSSEWLVLQ